jgi:hypothetical protein
VQQRVSRLLLKTQSGWTLLPQLGQPEQGVVQQLLVELATDMLHRDLAGVAVFQCGCMLRALQRDLCRHHQQKAGLVVLLVHAKLSNSNNSNVSSSSSYYRATRPSKQC